LLKNIKHPFSFIKTSPFIYGNPRSVNIFLFLFVVSYFVVGADLCKEIAKEKDEIGFFIGVIEESLHVDSSLIIKLIDSVPQATEVLPPIVFSIHATDYELFPPGRSPPENPI